MQSNHLLQAILAANFAITDLRANLEDLDDAQLTALLTTADGVSCHHCTDDQIRQMTDDLEWISNRLLPVANRSA